MPMGHLMLGLLCGVAAFALALVARMPLWVAAALFVGVSNLAVLVSVALQLWADHNRRPPRRRPRAPRKAAPLRPLHAPH